MSKFDSMHANCDGPGKSALPYLGGAKAPCWVCVLCGELLRAAAGVGLGCAWARAADAKCLLLMLLGDEGLQIACKVCGGYTRRVDYVGWHCCLLDHTLHRRRCAP
jgi:hypothetical protein